MLGYDYEVIYRKGFCNATIDALSRNKLLLEVQTWQLIGCTVVFELLNKVQALYKSDDKLH